MKKVFVLLLALALLLGLCACGSVEDEGEKKQDVAVNLPESGRKAPSEEVIMEDIRSELKAKNQHASLVGVEAIKSLTDEGSYEITLEITAETKYADWTYEVELSYTKYDQGWMLDDVDWRTEQYTLMRQPTQDEMTQYVTQVIQKECYKDSHYNAMFPLENVQMECDILSERIVFKWHGTEQLLHAERKWPWTSYWRYDSMNDKWIAIADENGYIADYDVRNNVTVPYDLDYSGTWEDQFWGKITIKDFSWDEFYIYYPNMGEGTIRFYCDGTDKTMFTDGNGHIIDFSFSEKGTGFLITNEAKDVVYGNFSITCDLPQLP